MGLLSLVPELRFLFLHAYADKGDSLRYLWVCGTSGFLFLYLTFASTFSFLVLIYHTSEF